MERKKQGLDKDLEEGLESERDKTKLMQHVAVEGKTKIDFLLQKDKEFEVSILNNYSNSLCRNVLKYK